MPCRMENSVNPVQKPADLDLLCFQFKEFTHGISKVRAKLSSLCIIYSLGQVKFPLDKYIMAIYLSLGKYFFFLLFPHPCINDFHTSALMIRIICQRNTKCLQSYDLLSFVCCCFL